nr:glutathione S-transferase [Spodoptera frugiperda]
MTFTYHSDHKMAPILYKVDASPPGNAVRILSEIIGLELEVRDVNFGALEHKSPEYLKVSSSEN